MNEQTIDPDVLALLAEFGPAQAPAAELTADQLRQGMREAIALFTRDAQPSPVDHVSDHTVPGRLGPIPVRVYAPEQPNAVIAYYHGGAWITGGIDSHDFVTRRISYDTGAVVVSVDYRMLPEHPFPAPFDDAHDAAVWASALHPELPFLVAGDSAGGTLSACLALFARDQPGLRIDGQVLVYPGIDDDMDAPSMVAEVGDPRISRDDLEFFMRNYAGGPAGAGSAYALPGRAASLADLPEAIMVVAGHDRLRSSEEDYAARMQAAGVPVTVQLDPELVHGWIDFAPRVAAADRAFGRLTRSISELISRRTAAVS